jgi:hypothetical protein
METTITLSDADGSAIKSVARLVAKGEPPDWLLRGLEHFSAGIGADREDQYRDALKPMADATDKLLYLLQVYEHLPFGLERPADVGTLLDVLPRLKEDLDRITKPRRVRTPDVRREICAAVIIEAWKLLHGEAEPRSESFEQACADYWQACGGEEIGETNDPSNWRWSIERALKKAEGYQWVNKVLTMARNAPE